LVGGRGTENDLLGKKTFIFLHEKRTSCPEGADRKEMNFGAKKKDRSESQKKKPRKKGWGPRLKIKMSLGCSEDKKK